MRLSPFMKKVEIEAGFRGFYKSGCYKVTVTVEENGIGVIADSRDELFPQVGELYRLFKPMRNLREAKSYAERLDEVSLEQLADDGFIELSSVKMDEKLTLAKGL